MTNPSPPRVNPRSPTMPPAGPPPQAASAADGSQWLVLVLSWAGVGLPLAWGVMETLRKTLALFQ
jgi:hypothetical protein